MSKPKSPNRNKFKRWLMQGVWEDMDGAPHLDIPGIHQWMRDHGFSVTDTKEEIEDTAQRLLQVLAAKGFDPKTVIIRRSRKD